MSANERRGAETTRLLKKCSMFMRRIRWIEFRPAFVSVYATVVACLLLTEPIPAVELTPSSSPSPPTMPRTSSIYAKMVIAMRRESPPSAISYDETFTPSGLKVTIEAGRRQRPRPYLVFSPDAQQEVFEVTQRDTAGAADVVDRTTGQRFSGSSIFWAPTWLSVHSAGPLSARGAALGSPPSPLPAVRRPLPATSAEPACSGKGPRGSSPRPWSSTTGTTKSKTPVRKP